MSSFPDQRLTVNADHLTPDQLDDHLIGDLAPAPAAHLAACTLCADRAAAAASPLASFHQVSTAWSERRSATLPLPLPAPQRPFLQRHMAWATASLSLAFGIAMINASGIASHPFAFETAPQPARARQTPALPAPALQATIERNPPAQRPSRISADNQMLRAIDASLEPSTDSPAALGLTAAAYISTGPPTSLQY